MDTEAGRSEDGRGLLQERGAKAQGEKPPAKIDIISLQYFAALILPFCLLSLLFIPAMPFAQLPETAELYLV